jgi:ubiquinone/menaquinone biosynthesis C-methylase UbiE
MDTARASAQARLLDLLLPDVNAGAHADRGYLDLLGDAPQAGPVTGITQRLMRTTALPAVYERYWRPFLGRLIKGRRGPSMAEEHRFAQRSLALRPGATVLDVACGTGAFTRGFAGIVGQDGLAIGLDASRPMLERAVAETPPGAPVAYLRADAVHPPLRDATIDGVCCFAALHMFADPEAALSSFARVLRPGGRLTLLTSAKRPSLATLDDLAGRLTGQRMFGRDELAHLLHTAGFTGVTATYAGPTQLIAAHRA